MVPVFEAVYNSIHAIQDRFGDEWCERGEIYISLIDFDSSRPNIQIRDNGVGLDKDNFGSFRTYDSGHKVRRGGKGLGRLSWLKVFEGAKVDSYFEDEGKLWHRQFLMQLNNDHPLAEYKLLEATNRT
ncbi:hypothetical protein AJ87_48720 [Rhizobium yanglingense]|nr:hypothetical protein AJ87_48720 [Rhizobium yanglingense]